MHADRLPSRDRRSASCLPFAVAAGVLSRVVVFAASYYWVTRKGELSPSLKIRDPRFAEALHGFAGRLLDPMAHWDGVWFVRIASQGYVHDHSPAFFPLYPLAMRAVSYVTGGNYVVAGVVVSLAAYAVSMVLLYKLALPLFGPRVAAWSVAFISWFPTSVFLSAVYSESLFLMFTLAAFWFATRRNWALAGLAGLLAALTRNSGVLLVVPLLLLYGRERGWSWRHLRFQWLKDLRLGWLALVPAGLLLYMGYLQVKVGNAMKFTVAEEHWHRHLSDPINTVIDGYRMARHGTLVLSDWRKSLIGYLEPGHVGQLFATYQVAPFVALAFAVPLIVVGIRRLPWAYTAWAVVGLLLPLMYPAAERPLYSLHRFVLVLFPLFIAEALALDRLAVVRWLLLAVSAALMIWYTFVFAAFAPIG